MKIIQVAHEKQCPSPHYSFLNSSPESAAMTVAEKFKQVVETVYVRGNFVYIPITIHPDHFGRR
jgi:hypothetical protein